MRFAAYRSGKGEGLAVQLPGDEFRGLSTSDAKYPGSLAKLISAGPNALHDAAKLEAESIALARTLADGPYFAHGVTKPMLNQEWAMGLDEMIESEAQACDAGALGPALRSHPQ